MRFLTLLALVPLVSAQYFSPGWEPGQQAPHTHDAPPPAYTPPAEQPQHKSLSELFTINTLLTLPPVASVFERFGINITERVALTKATLWDERIPLITDDNYQDLIVNESLTEEEEKNRVWVAVISVTAAKQDGISKYLDQIFDSAYNTTVHNNDLPNVRWGRIDYLNVTYLTTKWNVWQAPFLVLITDRGQALRFYKPYEMRLRDYALREYLLNEEWQNSPAWESRYAPGGDREWIIDIFAICLAKVYNIVVMIPRWILFIITGGIGSVIINFLHRPSRKRTAKVPTKHESVPASGTQSVNSKPGPSTSASTATAKVKSEPAEKPAASTTATASPPATPRRSGRKGKGKKQQA